MSRNDGYLFSKYDLRATIENQEAALCKDIDSYPGEQLLNVSITDYVQYLVAKYRLPPIVVDESSAYVDQREHKVDVSRSRDRFIYDRSKPFYITGTLITLEVPFEGDADLLYCRPSTYTLSPPSASICDGKIVISVTSTNHDGESVRRELIGALNSIKEYISWVNRDIAPWNLSIEEKAKGNIDKRKEKLLKDRGLVASLGFPMKKREDISGTYAAQNVRRIIVPRSPVASTAAYHPEPMLEMQEYERILGIIQSTARMLERSPSTFRGMDEEQLRDQFLVPLNSHYEGQVSGETFNYNGKTDIIILAEGRAIFIAECKIWHGPKALLDAMDQLLGYATWRDTKVAVIIFNKNKDLTRVLAAIPECVLTHKNCKKRLDYKNETGFRFLFHHKDDANRELILSVLVFEVP